MPRALPPLDPVLWERARRLWVETRVQGREIARGLGVTERRLYHLMRVDGWPRRMPRPTFVPGPGPPLLPGWAPGLVPAPPDALPTLPDGPAPARGLPVASAEGGPEPADDALTLPDAPDGPLRVRLERLLAHRIGLLEREVATGRAVDPDANARALATNARTLAVLLRLPEDPASGVPERNSPDGTIAPPPRDLSALRDELRRHLERVRAEERARRVRGRAVRP